MEQASLAAGQLLGHYRIEEKLGEGGMGVIFRATDTRLDRTVAIKLLRADALRDPERRRRFILEAKAASALNHPNIVTIHAIEQTDGVNYIVMEFVTGRTLGERIASGLTLAQSLDYGVQIASALARAHASGIIHRDIKPDNVIVDDDGRARVLDFGLAKLLEHPEERRATAAPSAARLDEGTQFGAIIGTLEYLSPEQAAGAIADARSDVFSFGCVMYEMLTGIRPFASKSSDSNDILRAVQMADPPPPSTVAPTLPEGIERLVMRTLRKQQDQRFQHMGEVEAALRAEIAALERRERRKRQRKFYWAGGIVAAVVIAAVAWLWPRRIVRPPTTILPVTSYPGAEIEPAISPDGTQVAFLWDGDEVRHFDVYVKPVGGAGDPVRLTNDPDQKSSPLWMRDGKNIVFLRKPKGQRPRIVLEPAAGGPERELVAGIGSFDISPDGRSLLFMTLEREDDGKMILLDLASGQRRVINNSPPGFELDRKLRFSPDGRSVAFIREKTGSSQPTVSVLSLATGEVKTILTSRRGISGIAWTNDGKEILYSWEPLGRQPSLYRVPISGGTPEAVLNNAYTPSVARAARRLAFTQNFYNSNVYRLPLPPVRSGTPAGPITARPQKLISSALLNDSAQYSPDGSHIAFVSNRDGDMDIWVTDADGHHPVQLTHMAGTGSPRWSPDGRWIAFDAHPQGKTHVFKISADGGEPISLTDSPSLDVLPAWSGDGKWVFFTSNRSGDLQLWKVPSNGGQAIAVTTNGAWESHVSIDGRTVYYSKAPADGIWQIPADGGPETRLDGPPAMGTGRPWAVAADGIYFVDSRADQPGASLQFFSFATKKTTVLYTSDTIVQPGKPNLSVSRDGKWVIYGQMDVLSYDVAVLDNFQ